MYTGKNRQSTLTRISKYAKERLQKLAKEQGKTETQVLDEVLENYKDKNGRFAF